MRLDSQALLMDPTYVSLFSQKTFKIINRSEDTLAFCFKQFAGAAEEIKARMRFGAGMNESMEEDIEYDDTFHNDSFALCSKIARILGETPLGGCTRERLRSARLRICR